MQVGIRRNALKIVKCYRNNEMENGGASEGRAGCVTESGDSALTLHTIPGPFSTKIK